MEQVKILTTDNKKKILLLTKEERQELELELAGQKPYVQEYKMIDNKIITDLEILNIIS